MVREREIHMANWDKIGSSGNVEDRRGAATQFALGGGGMGLAVLAIVTLFNIFSGGQTNIPVDEILNQLQQVSVQQQPKQDATQFQGVDSYEKFASTVLGSTNDVWTSVFKQKNKVYQPSKLVLFRDATQSGCGFATSQVGPHYCPVDQTIYLDETFFDELTKRFGAKGGDVAQAYVIAHEVGHHVQNQLGIMDELESTQARGSHQANKVSVQVELQADCFAGVWANSLKDVGVFENGEINEAIDAAAAVGDDRIQEKAQGYTDPESWTHGSSEERVYWFNQGYETGQPSKCSTI
jgi:predicted metalloprotease